MKKILNLITSIVISASSASSVVSCGTPDGPSVAVTLYKNSKDNGVNAYDTKNGQFDGLIKNIALPMLTIMNQNPSQNKSDEKEGKTHFSDAVLNKSSLLSPIVKNKLLKDPANTGIKEFYKIYDSADNSFFTNININNVTTKPSSGQPIGKITFQQVPYFKDIKNIDNYKDSKNPCMSEWKGGGVNKLWADSKVTTALSTLNSSLTYNGSPYNAAYSKFITSDKAPTKPPTGQIYTHALLQLQPLSFTSILRYKSEKFEVESTLKNLVANIDFKYTQIGKTKQYVWAWLLDGYDYYNQSSIPKTASKPNGKDFYLSKNSFPTRSVTKNKKDANFPDYDLTIVKIIKL